jgi:hypothetical protein
VSEWVQRLLQRLQHGLQFARLFAYHLHTSACVSIRQHTSAYILQRLQHALEFARLFACHLYTCVSIRQHTSAYVSIRVRAALGLPA